MEKYGFLRTIYGKSLRI